MEFKIHLEVSLISKVLSINKKMILMFNKSNMKNILEKVIKIKIYYIGKFLI